MTGGVTGRGFVAGRSGKPGGRPKGLARRVRELVGDDGEQIILFLLEVLNDPRQRTRDRLEAARLLADRGWGKPIQAVDLDVAVDTGGPILSVERLKDRLKLLAPAELDMLADLAERGYIALSVPSD